MKITNVESCTITIPLTEEEREAGAFGQFPLLKVETDEGIVGHGYAWGADRSYFEGVLRPGLVGKDPFAIEPLLEYGRELNYFTSGGPWPWVVEHALWDIIGKAAGLPVYKLLGGHKDKVKAYLTCIWPGREEDQDPSQHARDAVFYLERGFKGIKFRVHRRKPFDDLKVVEAVKNAVGDEMDVMVDATRAYRYFQGGSASISPSLEPWGHDTALKMAQGLEELGVAWLEEPLDGNDLDGLAELAAAVTIPISGGEAESGLFRFRELLERKCYDIVQPHMDAAGGILTIKKIAALAESYGKLCIQHSARGLGMAAPLQITGAIPNCPWIEIGTLTPPTLPMTLWEPLNRLLTEPLTIEDGYVRVPQRPGLGIEFDEKALVKCAIE